MKQLRYYGYSNQQLNTASKCYVWQLKFARDEEESDFTV